ncbi:magnesium-protoporphyrin IX monomethyl ester cyclase, partial [Mesorhizobium sp. M7A.F.Ca.CA.004.06.1.1]
MKIVLINPPHTAIGSRVPDDHLPPLGLLAIGGPLIDAGHQVRLVDAEFGPMPLDDVVRNALEDHPD